MEAVVRAALIDMLALVFQSWSLFERQRVGTTSVLARWRILVSPAGRGEAAER
jgi:hypothetical protein